MKRLPIFAALAAALTAGGVSIAHGRGPVRRRKWYGTKSHRRIAAGPGSLAEYDREMSDYLLLRALDQPCRRPVRRVEPRTERQA